MTDKLDITSSFDGREHLKNGYDYYVCTKCGFHGFILFDTSDSIFPDIICGRCGNSYIKLKENEYGQGI